MIRQINKDKFDIVKKISTPIGQVELSDLDYYKFDLNQIFKFDGNYYIQYHKCFLEATGIDDLETFLDVYSSDDMDLILSAASKGFDLSLMGPLFFNWALSLDKKVEKNIDFLTKLVDIVGNKYEEFLRDLFIKNVTPELNKKCLDLMSKYDIRLITPSRFGPHYPFGDSRELDDSQKKAIINSPKFVKKGLSKRELEIIAKYMDDKEEIKRIGDEIQLSEEQLRQEMFRSYDDLF